MNRARALRFRFSALAAAFAGALLLAFARPGAGPTTVRAPPALPADGSSLYELPLALTGDDGAPFRFDRFRGSFVAVALIFTRCPSICPKLVTQLKSAERAFSPATRERVRFLLVSIDPEHDTVERLREYRERMLLDRERFALVRADARDVRTLAASLGFAYETESGSLPTHSKLVTLLDPVGRVVLQRADLGAEPGALSDVVERSALQVGVNPE